LVDDLRTAELESKSLRAPFRNGALGDEERTGDSAIECGQNGFVGPSELRKVPIGGLLSSSDPPGEMGDVVVIGKEIQCQGSFRLVASIQDRPHALTGVIAPWYKTSNALSSNVIEHP
jgi:hypothetical protein